MRACVFALWVAAAFSQTPPAPDASSDKVLKYSGDPLNAGFHCTEDDIQWAGLTCTEQDPCPVYLELASIGALGQKLWVSGNLHSASTTLYSILLGSEDGGATWRESFERIRGGQLEHIQFFDFETGWIAGQLQQPLASDPFLLLTTDGGKSWRRRGVLDEGGPGSIQAFRFRSRKEGAIVLDRGQSGTGRYELYESPNGGESWMIRETGERPIRIPMMPPSENSGWRVDPAPDALRIQKQDGERWTTVASFLLRLGSCKPEPVREVEPPSAAEAPKKDYVEELRLGSPGRAVEKKKRPK